MSTGLKRLSRSRHVLSVSVAAAVLTGCAGSQPPIGAPAAMPQSGAIATHDKRGGFWTVAKSKDGDLLYISSVGYLTIMSYPAGKVVDRISESPGDQTYVGCSDPQNGHVFVMNGTDVQEYAHGGTSPIATLSTSPYGWPNQCSVGPTTGNLAVTNFSPPGVLIWQKAKGSPTWYALTHFEFADAIVYDSSEDLYVTAWAKRQVNHLLELRGGSTTWKIIRYPEGGSVNFHAFPPSRLQWDGKYLAFVELVATYENEVYQLQVIGEKSKLVNKAPLYSGNEYDGDFWLSDGVLFGFYKHERKSGNWAVAVWRYPKGRRPITHFYGVENGRYAFGGALTVSVPPSR